MKTADENRRFSSAGLEMYCHRQRYPRINRYKFPVIFEEALVDHPIYPPLKIIDYFGKYVRRRHSSCDVFFDGKRTYGEPYVICERSVIRNPFPRPFVV